MTLMPQAGPHHNVITVVFGTCKNPWNTDRNTGGSSGGSAGVIATKSAPIAIGKLRFN